MQKTHNNEVRFQIRKMFTRKFPPPKKKKKLGLFFFGLMVFSVPEIVFVSLYASMISNFKPYFLLLVSLLIILSTRPSFSLSLSLSLFLSLSLALSVSVSLFLSLFSLSLSLSLSLYASLPLQSLIETKGVWAGRYLET